MTTPPPICNLLTIAGSDPSGGAGIQADIKTFSALGTYATSVVTALTAQNTRGVRGIHPVPASFIAAQLDTLLEDVGIDAVKIGMVASPQVAEVIAESLRTYRPRWVILDPVMVAKSGDVLLDDAAIEAVRDILVPIADVITPNLPEAGVLVEQATPDSSEEMEAIMPALLSLGAPWVMLKGGHLSGETSPDLLAGPEVQRWLTDTRIDTRNLHGTGCSLSSAIAAHLARQPDDDSPEAAITAAKQWLQHAIDASRRLDVGDGQGPVHHFHAWW